MSRPKTRVVWSDDSLIVDPTHPHLENRLSYHHRSINREEDCVDIVKTDIFRVDNDGRLITFQGLKDNVLALLAEARVEVELCDIRVFRRVPELFRMRGFRGSQRELLTKALAQCRSGLIQAPTRYGKSTLLENILRAFPGVCTVVTMPGRDLIRQCVDKLKREFPDREIVGLYAGSKHKFQGDDITVVSMDSLFKCNQAKTQLVIVDEPHAVVTDSRGIHLDRFMHARRYGLGATLDGRFDGSDILVKALIGPVLARRTFPEAVSEKAICPIDVIVLPVPFSAKFPASADRDEAYRKLVKLNAGVHDAVAHILNEVVPPEWQTIAFVDSEKQGKALTAKVTDGKLAMAKTMTTAERADMFASMQGGVTRRCVGSGIYSTGVTFSGLRAGLNACGGGASITVIQKVGRLAEIIPGKRSGVFFDFLFHPDDVDPFMPWDVTKVLHAHKKWSCVWRDSHSRLKLYRSTGYNVHLVRDMASLKTKFTELQ